MELNANGKSLFTFLLSPLSRVIVKFACGAANSPDVIKARDAALRAANFRPRQQQI
jgi:hypothetical protein